MMYAVVELSIFIITACLVRWTEAVEKYNLDDRKVCHSTGVMTKWMADEDVIMIYGKKDPESSFTECEMVFGPGTEATKLSTMIQFQTYANKECAVYLLFEQSPYQFFDKEVSTVVNLTCLNQPGAKKFYTDAASNLRIKLHKTQSHLRNYNFIFNITLTDHEIHTEVSSIIIIIIGIIIAIIIPLIGCIVYKALKIKRWSKQHYSSSGELSQPGNQHLRSFESHSTPQSVRYSSMPHDQDNNGSLHSQTCIVGSQGADGRCTVCNRSHEDFAHVVDLDSQGVVLVDAPRANGRSHEDFSRFEEISAHTNSRSAENERLIGRNNQPLVLRHSANAGGTRSVDRYVRSRNIRGTDDGTVSDDEDDIDVSGNDLIPPSYDLCPPSYDEAVDMPTPAGQVSGSSLEHEEESNPLYQNIDDILTRA